MATGTVTNLKCPGCKTNVDPELPACLNCHRKLQQNCPTCTKLVLIGVANCPECTAEMPKVEPVAPGTPAAPASPASPAPVEMKKKPLTRVEAMKHLKLEKDEELAALIKDGKINSRMEGGVELFDIDNLDNYKVPTRGEVAKMIDDAQKVSATAFEFTLAAKGDEAKETGAALKTEILKAVDEKFMTTCTNALGCGEKFPNTARECPKCKTANPTAPVTKDMLDQSSDEARKGAVTDLETSISVEYSPLHKAHKDTESRAAQTIKDKPPVHFGLVFACIFIGLIAILGMVGGFINHSDFFDHKKEIANLKDEVQKVHDNNVDVGVANVHQLNVISDRITNLRKEIDALKSDNKPADEPKTETGKTDEVNPADLPAQAGKTAKNDPLAKPSEVIQPSEGKDGVVVSSAGTKPTKLDAKGIAALRKEVADLRKIVVENGTTFAKIADGQGDDIVKLITKYAELGGKVEVESQDNIEAMAEMREQLAQIGMVLQNRTASAKQPNPGSNLGEVAFENHRLIVYRNGKVVMKQ